MRTPRHQHTLRSAPPHPTDNGTRGRGDWGGWGIARSGRPQNLSLYRRPPQMHCVAAWAPLTRNPIPDYTRGWRDPSGPLRHRWTLRRPEATLCQPRQANTSHGEMDARQRHTETLAGPRDTSATGNTQGTGGGHHRQDTAPESTDPLKHTMHPGGPTDQSSETHQRPLGDRWASAHTDTHGAI